MINHRSLQKSFGYAIEGVAHAFTNNQNLRIHTSIAILVLLAGFFFQLTSAEFVDLVVMIIVLIAAEMINTSIEEMTNLITTEHRQQAKIAKDVAAGMVLVAAIGSVLVGLLIFLPHILHLFGI